MDQRLTSKRWLLALSALILLAIGVLLLPDQVLKDRVSHPPDKHHRASSEAENASTRPHQLQSISPPSTAIALTKTLETAIPGTESTSTPLKDAGLLQSTELFQSVGQIVNSSRSDSDNFPFSQGTKNASPLPLLSKAAFPQIAYFEEAVSEQRSSELAFAHRNASFDSRTDSAFNDLATVRLAEWRRLLGVQVPPTLPDAEVETSDSIADESQDTAEEEDFGDQVEEPDGDIFAPLMIAAVPNQEQYVRETTTNVETISVAVALSKDDEILDEEGYWEPVPADKLSLPTLPPVANAATTISGLPLPVDHFREIKNDDLPVAGSAPSLDASAALDVSAPQVASLDSQADSDRSAWQMRSAILASPGATRQPILPAATPVFPQGNNTSGDAAAEEKEDKEKSEAAPQAQEDTANEDKKMIGHLAGKFGSCFRSSISCGLYFGNEFTFLGAETPGTTRVRVIDTISSQIDEYSSEDAFGFGNRLTLGIQSQNIGFRVVYWNYAGSYNGHDAWKDLDSTPVYSTTTKVGLETVDIDLMQKYCFLGCDLMTACGVRFAEYQGSDFTALTSTLQGMLETSGNTRSFRSMQGFGPTFFMELRKTIPWCLGHPARMPRGMIDPGSTGCFGCCQSDCSNYGNCGGCGGCDSCSLGAPCFPWRFYANFRVSALWADTYSESMTESVVATGDGIVTQGIARGRDKATLGMDDENSLLTTQIQFGLEHRTPILCDRALWICRLGLEIQSWDTGKHSSLSQSYAFLEDPADQFGGRVETLSRADNRYLNLFGFTFLLGLNY